MNNTNIKCSDCEQPIDKLRRVEDWLQSAMEAPVRQTLILSTTIAMTAYCFATIISIFNDWHTTIWPWNHPAAVLLSIAAWCIIFTLGTMN